VDRKALEGHLVICHWAPRGLHLVREVHSRLTDNRRPIVIIDEQAGSIDLPEVKGDGAFEDVYIVRGDPVNAVILRRARVPEAYSVVVLADDREGRHADGKSILTCIAIRDACRAGDRPNVVAECRNPDFRPHLFKAGADEVVSSEEMGLQLMARAALFHGMSYLYQELLTVGRDANEMYLVRAPEAMIGRDFVEVNALFARHRRGIRSCLVIGIQRGEEMHLNPIDGEAGPLRPGDELIVLSRAAPDPSLSLPTDPPIDTTPAIARGAALVAEADR
jgi:voltage-gated potassium channel